MVGNIEGLGRRGKKCTVRLFTGGLGHKAKSMSTLGGGLDRKGRRTEAGVAIEVEGRGPQA